MDTNKDEEELNEVEETSEITYITEVIETTEVQETPLVPVPSNDETGLREMKSKMIETEKQINNILVRIDDLTESVNSIKKKMEEKPVIEYQNQYNGSTLALQTVDTEPTKRKAKRYKENSKLKSCKKKLGWIGELAFYGILIAMVLGAFFVRSNSSGKPTMFANYSFFTVLTGSMESEIPQGSLVLTEHVDPNTLQIGDDITFMANQNTTITHRIISIVENYKNTGERAFETKGVMNQRPDKNLVPAVNVVGKVIYHNKMLGQIATFVGENWIFMVFVVAVIIIFINVMKNVLKNDGDDVEKSPKSKETRMAFNNIRNKMNKVKNSQSRKIKE